jgi:hypothetical protein
MNYVSRGLINYLFLSAFAALLFLLYLLLRPSEGAPGDCGVRGRFSEAETVEKRIRNDDFDCDSVKFRLSDFRLGDNPTSANCQIG